MGVPALFRWLSKRYPKITSKVIEELPVEMNGYNIPVDLLKANPNGIEFDNLYLDMNGIVHPCTHPEDRPPPKTEDEAMILIFEYIDRIVGMVRPRKVLYMAIDGVAPRAKMNQQRSRRFRAALDLQLKDEEEQVARDRLNADGISTQKEVEQKFDSNCITPGTPFMKRLAECLRFYIADRLNRNPGWKNLKVILSDASVPGEGEHKIMDFIRAQRLLPKYNTNIRHVIYGLDADLIMLALATHEPHFYVLREDVFSQESKISKCDICGALGHHPSQCTGKAIGRESEDKVVPVKSPLKPFVLLHVTILREYLDFEMRVPNLPFSFDLERAIDDWVFMCFFVGNDFLPHLPSLDIREGAIEMLIDIYKRKLPSMGGYLTQNGNVNLALVQVMMEEVGEREDEIFRKRREGDERRRANGKKRKADAEAQVALTMGIPFDRMADMANIATSVKDAKSFQATNKAYADSRKDIRTANMSAAAALKAALGGSSSAEAIEEREVNKRKRESEEDPVAEEAAKRQELDAEVEESTPAAEAEEQEADAEVPEEKEAEKTEPEATETDAPEETAKSQDDDDEPNDDVRLWEAGWKERYYQTKFEVELANMEFRKKIVHAYTEGLCWVLKYYYQGCPSWKWYYPYHYSPFASDFTATDLAKEMKVQFSKGKPFQPLEQLMGVLPAASKSHIPALFHDLMTDPESEIIDFYPERFAIDLNGKKFSWQGVALLPFIEEKRLLKAMKERYTQLDEDGTELNRLGVNLLFVSKFHSMYEFLCDLYAQSDLKKKISINMNISDKLGGFVHAFEGATLPGSTLYSPLTELGVEDVPDNAAICAVFIDPKPPKPDYEYPSSLLPGVSLPQKSLTYDDFLVSKQGGRRGGREQGRREGRYRDSGDRYAQSGGNSYASKEDRRYDDRRYDDRRRSNYSDDRRSSGGYYNNNNNSRGGNSNFNNDGRSYHQNQQQSYYNNYNQGQQQYYGNQQPQQYQQGYQQQQYQQPYQQQPPQQYPQQGFQPPNQPPQTQPQNPYPANYAWQRNIRK